MSNPAPPAYTATPFKYDEEATEPLLSDSEPSNSQDRAARYHFKGPNVSQSSVDVRNAFVFKVYSILSVQILGTILMSATFMYNDTIRTWVQQAAWLFYISLFGSLIVLFFLYSKSESFPTNFYLLALWTAMESYTIGVAVTFFDKMVVLQALIITFGLFVGLTLFASQSKYDFSSWAPFLLMILLLFVGFSFIQIFLPFSNNMDLVTGIIGSILFSAFILMDTHLLFNRLSPDEYITASVALYLDFINLFLQLLKILSSTRD
jgi:FtsH-binding integral membrane protein